MDKSFWDDRWTNREIAFHLEGANPCLEKHFGALSLICGASVLVPLCGKSRDIDWLIKNGCKVIGIELSQIAVEELFEEIGVSPEKTRIDALVRYSGPNLVVFLGDFFETAKDLLGPVDAIYDRAALVALPEQTRRRYSEHLMRITDSAKQLLVGYEYDQSLLEGPPFSVVGSEIRTLYQKNYDISCLEVLEIEGGLKKKCKASEAVWLLNPK